MEGAEFDINIFLAGLMGNADEIIDSSANLYAVTQGQPNNQPQTTTAGQPQTTATAATGTNPYVYVAIALLALLALVAIIYIIKNKG